MAGAAPARETVPPRPRRQWSRFRYPDSLISFAIQLAVLVFIAYSAVHLDVRFERLAELLQRVWNLLADRYWPPNLTLLQVPRFQIAVVDTIIMAYLGLVLGVLFAAPLAWCASRNVTPNRHVLYPAARLVVMSCRAVHEMIWTILFVSILGFGMLAGVLALTLFCIGFAAKLFAEEVEAIDPGPVEAMRAAGANELQVFAFAVIPQVRVAWTGITIYTWDVAFRAATVVGFFGAGGMGWYLQRYVQQLDNRRVAAVLVTIVVLVSISEVVSAWARNRIARGK
jgi:phosphonate transport system permease protein